MKATQSIFTGFCLGIFALSLILINYVDNMRIKQIQLETERLEEFKQWADEICAGGYSTAEFLQTGEYKATCR